MLRPFGLSAPSSKISLISWFFRRAFETTDHDVIKGHLSPFCACTAVWFLVRRTIFQSWYMWEKSFSIDLMRRVKIEIPILKNCLVLNGIFCALSWKPSRKYDVLERGFSNRLETKATCNRVLVYLEEKIEGRRSETQIAADVDTSWDKVRRTRPSHNINIINMPLQTKTQKPADKCFRKAREIPGEFVALVIVLRFLLVIPLTKNGVNQERTCALSWQWPFKWMGGRVEMFGYRKARKIVSNATQVFTEAFPPPPLSLGSLRIDDFCTTPPLDCVTCSLRMPFWALVSFAPKSTTLVGAICRRLGNRRTCG